MRRVADLHEVQRHRAYIINEAARSMPQTLRSLEPADNEVAKLTMLCGVGDD